MSDIPAAPIAPAASKRTVAAIARADGPTEINEDTPVIEVVPQAKVAPTDARVKITITKFGAGKVATGEHIAGVGDVMAQRGDTLLATPVSAAALEKLGYAEAD